MHLSAALVLSAAPGQVIKVRAAESALDALGREIVFDDGWITRDVCWRALFTIDADHDLAALRMTLRSSLSSSDFDVNVVPDDLAFTTKRLICADMESTLIEQEMIDETARMAGVWEDVSRITAATMRGELPFEASLRQRIRHFKGLPLRTLEDLVPRMTLMPGADVLFRGLKRHCIKTAIITGGFSFFAEIIGARLGADHVIANRLEVVDGRLTGNLIEPVIGIAGKEEALKGLASSAGIDLMQTLAVGDGANDVGMLATAGLGVAFRAKPKVRDLMLSHSRGAVFDHADLTGLLDLQGLSRGEVSQ